MFSQVFNQLIFLPLRPHVVEQLNFTPYGGGGGNNVASGMEEDKNKKKQLKQIFTCFSLLTS